MTQTYPGREHQYNLLVVGAGLTGSEAAWACARAGLDTLLITTSLDTVYNLTGPGARLDPPTGTLLATLYEGVKDEAGMAATWDLHRAAKGALETTPQLHLLQSSVSTLTVEGHRVTGVTTWEGVPRTAHHTALCVGSFLHARLTVGTLTETAGRLTEMAYDNLFDNLTTLGFTFAPLVLEAPATGGSLPYRVDCQVFAPTEREGSRLPRLSHLWAAGVCARGYLPYEAAVLEGQALARDLIAALS